MIGKLTSLWRDKRGSVVIETAVAAPVLALLGLGAFQMSEAYARQHELQTGADDAAAMALAGWSTSTGNTSAIRQVVRRTLELEGDQVAITTKYRCGTDTGYVTDKTICASGSIVTTYLEITLTDTYTPVWSEFGVGGPINYNVQRTVLVS